MIRALIPLMLAAAPALAVPDLIDIDDSRPPLPDLVVQAVGAQPIVVPHGASTVIEVDVLNRGTAASPATDVRFPIGKRHFPVACPALAPGERCRARWTFDFTPGDLTREACVDHADAVPELSEGNNCLSIAIHVEGPPVQVVFDGFAFDPPNPLPGDPVEAVVRTRNVSGQSASYPVDVMLGVAPIGRRTCPALLGDDPCVVRIPLTAPAAGDHYYRAFAGEASLARLLTVEPDDGPNLTLTPDDVTRSITAPAEGDVVAFTAWIRNAGDAATTRGFYSWLYFDGVPVRQVWCAAGLAPGQRCGPHTFETVVDAGPHVFSVDADSADVIDEPAEFDNLREMPFTVTDAPLSCEGQWTLLGDDGHVASSPGYVVDGCDVYWGANLPTGCMTTIGDQGMTVVWSSPNGFGCPRRAVVTLPDGSTLGYSVSIH